MTEPEAKQPSGGVGPQGLLAQLDRPERTIAACGLGAAVLVMLPWWKVSIRMGDKSAFATSASAIGSWQGVFVLLGALGALVTIVGPKLGVLTIPAPKAARIALLSMGVATLFALIGVLAGGGEIRHPLADFGTTLWAFLCLLVLAYGTWVALQRAQQLPPPAAPDP